jgi:hypothetical protein
MEVQLPLMEVLEEEEDQGIIVVPFLEAELVVVIPGEAELLEPQVQLIMQVVVVHIIQVLTHQMLQVIDRVMVK